MTTLQQGQRQASVRAVTGTAWDDNGDWHALFDAAGIAVGDFNGRLIQWINLKLGTAYTAAMDAVQALAEWGGAVNFSSLGTFDAAIGSLLSFLLQESGDFLLLEDGVSKLALG